MSTLFVVDAHVHVRIESPSTAAPHTPQRLVQIASEFAASSEWMHRVRLNTKQRWYERLVLRDDYDVWILSWLPGQSTGFHDHGESAGAFTVVTGALQEHRPGENSLAITPGESRSFGAGYAHDVRNGSLAPAISIHVYSPPLNEMNHYELEGDQLELRSVDAENVDRWSQTARNNGEQFNRGRSIEQVLSDAHARLQRLYPLETYKAVQSNKGVLIDIRPEAQRAREGHIPGALIVERNVLEWRFDPASDARLPIVNDYDLFAIVFCSEGYTSSLAAVALQELGLWRATDVIGGFQAWREAGLPTELPSAV